MEFNLYKYEDDAIHSKWVRFPATVLGLEADGTPFVDLWRQERKVFKDSVNTTVNTDLGKISVTLADIGDPAAVTFDTINPITGEVIGTMSVADYIAASYSFGIWLDQRNETAATPEPVL